MKKLLKHFDTTAEPITTKWYLKPIMWALSAPALWMHRTKITKIGMDDVKAPYLLLCNHNSFFDFQVAVKATYPQNVNYVVALDAFVGFPFMKWLMLRVGCIAKRKFTNDVNLIRQLKKVVDRGNIACMYPEARYSMCGTTAVMPSSLGKFCKILGVPVVTLMCHGNHINAPAWNQKNRKVKGTQAELKLVLTADEVAAMSAEQINDRLVREFQYDDFKWQKDNKICITYRKRAQGLHKVLYQCPHCGTEYEMSSRGDTLSCGHCGKQWTMSIYGELSAVQGETEFSHIPDWYEWERENVRKEVESGRYGSGPIPVVVRTIPNNKPLLLGRGMFTHDADGFHVTGHDADGEPFSEDLKVQERYSCHVEFDYKKFGECLDMSTLKDTWFLSSKEKRFCLTKMALATEEMYKLYRKTHGKDCKPGLT